MVKERVGKAGDSCALEMITYYISHIFLPFVCFTVVRIVEGVMGEDDIFKYGQIRDSGLERNIKLIFIIKS